MTNKTTENRKFKPKGSIANCGFGGCLENWGLQKCTNKKDKGFKGLDGRLFSSHHLMTGLLFLGDETEQMYAFSPCARAQAESLRDARQVLCY